MRFLFILTILFSTLSTYAQLTPEQYRSEVVAYSWALKGAQNTLEQSEQSVAYTKTLLLPELSATGSYRYFLRQYEGQKPWSVALEPQFVQTIYGGGVVRAEVNKSELTLQAAICSANFTLLEVNYAAEYAYWNYWAMNRYYLVMEQYVEIIEQQLEKIRYKYSDGYTSKRDLLMVQSQLSEAEYNLISSNKSRMEALYNLNILRGKQPNDTLITTKFALENYPTPQRLPLARVIDQRPDYSAMLLKEQIAEVETRSVRGGYNPKILGGVAGGLRSYTPNISGDTYFDGSVYVSLSVPIYRFGERRKAVAVSRSSERQAHINSETLLDEIIQDESNAWLAVEQSRVQIDIVAKSLSIASENLEISTYSYNEGLVSILDLMQAQISWMQIYTNAISSEYSYLLALAYYWKTTGEYK
ncbi:MAG: TolC family protein [Rikenellaceae bacterium]